MKRWIMVGAAVAAMAVGQTVRADMGDSRLGLGVMYNVPVKNKGDFDSSKLSYLVSYQYDLSLLTLEADLEVLPSSLMGKVGYMPEVYALLGGFIYGGVGIGILYIDGEFASDPTYALRAGLDIPIGKIHLDVNANYRFASWSEVNSDTLNLLTIGAVARYEF